MYRSAARRLFPAAFCRRPGRLSSPASFSAPIVHQGSFSSGAAGNAQTHKTDNVAASNSSSSSSSYSSDEGRNPRTTARPEANWKEEQARVLQASLRHVIRLGWTDAAMVAGAREVGVSPSVVGSFPRKEAALVEFFMDDCLQKLTDIIDTKEDLKNLIPSHRVSKLIRIRLEMQAPYISKWPQALSIQALPLNISTSFKQRALLVDEIWHAAGDEATDIDWYVKRTVLGGIYSTTELYMLTDTSQDFQETWNFLDERVRDAFDLKKTLQEIEMSRLAELEHPDVLLDHLKWPLARLRTGRQVKYLAEAVGAGMGGPVQGFLNRVLRG